MGDAFRVTLFLHIDTKKQPIRGNIFHALGSWAKAFRGNASNVPLEPHPDLAGGQEHVEELGAFASLTILAMWMQQRLTLVLFS